MNLFRTDSLAGIQVRNHFIRAAVHERLAEDDGTPMDSLTELYESLARQEVGLIITGYTFITDYEKPSPHQTGIHRDHLIDAYARMTDAVHAAGGKIVMQLVHGSSRIQADPHNSRIIGPSAIPNPYSGIVPEEMRTEDIHQVAKLFADAARRAKEACFDGVELHGAHGMLISQFLSPKLNLRRDAYGGSREGRSRFLTEVVQAVRKSVGDDYPVFVKLNARDESDRSYTIDDFITAGIKAQEAGASVLEVSGECWQKHGAGEESYYREEAARLAEIVTIPVILTGGNRKLDTMEEISENSNIKWFGIARPLMKDPGFIKALRDQKEA